MRSSSIFPYQWPRVDHDDRAVFAQVQTAGARYGNAIETAIRHFGLQILDQTARILAMADALRVTRYAETSANEDVMFGFSIISCFLSATRSRTYAALAAALEQLLHPARNLAGGVPGSNRIGCHANRSMTRIPCCSRIAAASGPPRS